MNKVLNAKRFDFNDYYFFHNAFLVLIRPIPEAKISLAIFFSN